MSSQRVNQPRRHRDTEILCVFVSLWLILSVLSASLRVDYSDTLLANPISRSPCRRGSPVCPVDGSRLRPHARSDVRVP